MELFVNDSSRSFDILTTSGHNSVCPLRVGRRHEMSRIRWQDPIAIAPDLHHGDPCIQGTRILVSVIVGSLADGRTWEQVKEAYPQLSSEDIQAALAYAAEM